METNEEVVLKPIQFPPAVLNVIAPDVSLQRHVSLGLRPSLRGFEEFQNVQFQAEDGLARDSENVESPILASSVFKSGATTVICTITGGIIEAGDEEFGSEYTTVYPVVEVARGRISGPPTDEEMILGQRIHETILSSRIIPTDSLRINVGFKAVGDDGKSRIIFSDDGDSLFKDLTPSKLSYAFVLYANIQIFSRTGPLFDLSYGALIAALEKVKLPVIYIDESVSDLKVKTKNRSTIIQENHKLLCHPLLSNDLQIVKDNLNWSVTFGVVARKQDQTAANVESATADNILLADIEGEAEEASTSSRINIIINKKGAIKSLNVVNGTEDVAVQQNDIARAIVLAKKRVKHLLG